MSINRVINTLIVRLLVNTAQNCTDRTACVIRIPSSWALLYAARGTSKHRAKQKATETRNEERTTEEIKRENFSCGSETCERRWPLAVPCHEQMTGQTFSAGALVMETPVT
jgi:hypothetical protein